MTSFLLQHANQRRRNKPRSAIPYLVRRAQRLLRLSSRVGTTRRALLISRAISSSRRDLIMCEMRRRKFMDAQANSLVFANHKSKHLMRGWRTKVRIRKIENSPLSSFRRCTLNNFSYQYSIIISHLNNSRLGSFLIYLIAEIKNSAGKMKKHESVIILLMCLVVRQLRLIYHV